MDRQKNFKFIKGEYRCGAPADICFYTDVDYWSVDEFLYEFRYLTDYVAPSIIKIHINSSGGSVVDGISVFSKIIDCKIPTQCINDGLAASMGSIIWAAGDEVYMKDYALLMIHNPFLDKGDNKEYNQVTEAFTQQLKTIYIKRFGLTESEIEDVMNGKAGEDGTFFTAEQAVAKGFLKSENIIETPSIVRNKVQAALKGVNDISQFKAIYNLALEQPENDTIQNNQNNNLISNKMEKENIAVMAALLEIKGENANMEKITAKINELKAQAEKVNDLQQQLDSTKAELTKVNAELTGANTSINNLTEDLNQTKSALKVYQDAEIQAKEEKVNALIDQAVADCKISKDEVEAYKNMAKNDYELAVNVLSKIPARDSISTVIADANEGDAKKQVYTEEQQVFNKVNELVGDDFKFRSLE